MGFSVVFQFRIKPENLQGTKGGALIRHLGV